MVILNIIIGEWDVQEFICHSLIPLDPLLLFVVGQVKDATSEQIKHGGCLGLGLAAMGTHRADVYEQLKFCLYQVLHTF